MLNAAHLIDDDEPFFVFFADDFFRSDVPRAIQLREAHEKTGKSVISLIEVDMKDADKYGMVAISDKADDVTFRVTELVEKPGEAQAPSTFASVGGYLLTSDIWPILQKETVSTRGEIELSEAIGVLARTNEVYGRFIQGVWHDTGDQLKYLKAVVDIALESDEYGADFAEYLKNRL
ncbi:UTP--glucose-1-phosphate uridylyltransferase [compost metagenome]